MGERSDGELIALVRGGDAAALERLFERHYGGVYRLAWRWCGTRQDAEDIAQEVFVKLVRKLPTFEGRSSFATWLYRVVVNTARDHHRRSRAARTGREGYAEQMRGEADPGVGGGEDATGRLRAAVDSLPEKQKAALLLVAGEGLSHREAGEILGCPEVSVSWRIFQARRKLAKMLEIER